MFAKLRSKISSRLFGELLSGERSAKRFKLAGLAIGANVISKALGFLVLIYSTRVALEQLGPERFGVWITVSSISVLLGFMDFGVSNALISRIAGLSSRHPSEDTLPRIASCGLIILLGFGVIVAALLCLIFSCAPLSTWFKGISPIVTHEARWTGYTFSMAFGVSLSAQGVLKIYSGMQLGWVANLTTACGWIASLFLIALAPRFNAPMWFYLFATYGVQQLSAIALSCGLWRRGLLILPKNFAAEVRNLRKDAVFKQGQLFFIIQIAFAVGWGANQLILSSMLGPAEAGVFSVLQRLFMVVQVPLTIVNLPLWAMYSDAYAHREFLFIRKLLKRSMLTTLACSLVGGAIIIAGQRIFVGLLSGHKVSIAESTVILMAVWTVVEACGIAYSMYQNGVGRIRPQALTGVVHTLASVPIKIVAVRYFGLNGLVAAILFSYTIFIALPYVSIFRAESFDGIITD